MSNELKQALPPLPPHAGRFDRPESRFGCPAYTAEQMRDYALAVLAAAPVAAVVPEGWQLVPMLGTRVKADHPITVINPEETFVVTGIGIDHGRISLRGDDTCWFGVGMLAAAPQPSATSQENPTSRPWPAGYIDITREPKA